jgi:hypothetical protein
MINNKKMKPIFALVFFLLFCILSWSFYKIMKEDVNESKPEMKKHFYIRTTFQITALGLFMLSGYFYFCKIFCEQKSPCLR